MRALGMELRRSTACLFQHMTLHEQAVYVFIRVFPAVLMHGISVLAQCQRCHAIVLRHHDIPRMAEIDQREIDRISTGPDNFYRTV